MATSYKNRLVTTVSAVASAGLGAFTVSSASSGYTTFAAGDDGKSFDIVAVEGTAWEVRTGCVYTHSGTSLARGTLEASSTGSAVAFTSAVVLTVTPSAAKFAALEQQLDRAFTYVRNNGSSTQTLTSGATTILTTALDSIQDNPYSWWSNTTSRFTPTRAGNYFVASAVQISSSAAAAQSQILKNGTAAVVASYGASAIYLVSTAEGVVYLNGSTDYLQCGAFSSPGSTSNATTDNIYFKAVYLGP